MAGLWCVNVGYGREELARAAYEQMQELPFYNTFFKTATPPVVMLATNSRSSLGGELQHILLQQFRFGSQRHRAAHGAPLLDRRSGSPQRKIFISRWNAYHGSTVAGASLGGMKHMHAQGDLPIPGVEHVMQPYWFDEGFGEDEERSPSARRKRSKTAFSKSARRTSPPSSASRCRARAA